MNELVNILKNEFSDAEYAHAYLEENSNLRIAAQVRALRLRNNWSQEDLAQHASMRQERISKIEMADFDSLTLRTLRRLAQAFDVHLAVQFSSVSDAIEDFVTLSEKNLLCDNRVTALSKMAEIKNSKYKNHPQSTSTLSTFQPIRGNLVSSIIISEMQEPA